MKMNIKDYLHLYLGCEVDFVNEDGDIQTGMLTTVDVQKDLRAATIKYMGYLYRRYDDIQLHLRPLSSMTENDKKFYGNRQGLAYDPLEFIYLLKQGYDLFGLIDAGLAIDKTNQTTAI